MRSNYRWVNLMTIDGIKQGERLQRNGWTMINTTPFSITFEKTRRHNGNQNR